VPGLAAAAPAADQCLVVPQIYGAAVPLQPLQLVRLQPSVAEPCEAKQTCTGTAFDDAITYFRLDSIDHDSDVTVHVFTDDLHVCFYLGDATETGYRPSYLVATSYIGELPPCPLSVLQRAGTDICACSGALRVGAAAGACSQRTDVRSIPPGCRSANHSSASARCVRPRRQEDQRDPSLCARLHRRRRWRWHG
jgi:hypothetical protein